MTQEMKVSVGDVRGLGTLAGEMQDPVAPASGDIAVMRKVQRRLVGFLFVLFVFSFLDRINIGFAGLTMNRDLGLSATEFGFASTIFYVAYVCFGIPSNLMLSRVGARRWIAVIMIAWGIASTSTMFAWSAGSLYVLRVFVGITEAGFLPGILLYLTFWFPSAYRARANALFMIAMPVTSALGAIASGYVLKLDGVHALHGWQWLFLIEGFPAVVLGVATWFYLDDTPAKATWLNEDERAAHARLLQLDDAKRDAERATPSAMGSDTSVWGCLTSRPIVQLAVIYFLMVNTLGMISTWAPLILKSFSHGSSDFMVAVLSAVPHVCTVIAMVFWGRRSDKHQERRIHVAIPMAMAALGWLATAYGGSAAVKLAGLCAASAGAYAAMTIFWTLPDTVMPRRHRAVGIGFVNAAGIAGAALNAVIVGYLRDVTTSFTSGLVYAAVVMFLGAVLVLTFRGNGQRA